MKRKYEGIKVSPKEVSLLHIRHTDNSDAMKLWSKA